MVKAIITNRWREREGQESKRTSGRVVAFTLLEHLEFNLLLNLLALEHLLTLGNVNGGICDIRNERYELDRRRSGKVIKKC